MSKDQKSIKSNIIRLLKFGVRSILYVIAKLAWICHLKLPTNYRFVCLLSHGVGHNAMLRFLSECKVTLNWHCAENGEKRYCDIWRMLVGGILRNRFCVIAISELGFKDEKRFFASSFKPTDALCLVRDPISVLKSFVNMQYSSTPSVIKECRLDTSYGEILKVFYSDFTRTDVTQDMKALYTEPTLVGIRNLINPHTMSVIYPFIQNSLLRAFGGQIKKVHYMDMSAISKERAFESFQDLSARFGFNPPVNREFFEGKLYGSLHAILPFYLCVEYDTPDSLSQRNAAPQKQVFKILITTLQKQDNTRHSLDMTKHFAVPDEFSNIRIYADIRTYNDFCKAKNSSAIFDSIKLYLNGFFVALRVQCQTKKTISEYQIIEYLYANPSVALELKSLLDRELAHIKANASEIVQSWEYYQGFEMMCACILQDKPFDMASLSQSIQFEKSTQLMQFVRES